MSVNKNTKTKSAYAGRSRKLNEPKTPLFYLMPFLAVLAFIPLVIHYKSFENHLSNEYWHSSSTTTTDIFLYYKSQFFIVLSVILLLCLVIALVVETKKFYLHIEYIPLAVYLVFVVLSTFLSQNIYFSTHGIENHFEPVWVLLGYGIMVVYGAIMADNPKALRVIIYGWLAGTWALMLIGVFQAFKLDIFLSEFIKYIVLPENLRQYGLKLNFELGQVYITLYNPNYVGYFAAMTIPVFTILALYVKTWWKRVLFAVTVIGVFICEIGSSAKNGLLALIAVFLFLLIMFRKALLKNWIIVIGAIGCLVALFFGINAIRNNSMINSIERSFNLLLHPEQNAKRRVESITHENKKIKIILEGKTYYIDMGLSQDGAITTAVLDEENNLVDTVIVKTGSTNSVIAVDKLPYSIMLTPLQLQLAENQYVPCVRLSTRDSYSYVFTNQLAQYGYSNDFYYLNASGKFTMIENAETALFTNNPRLFSNRGYIWARTIPLLKKHILIGSGPDTFGLMFPNNDYVDASYIGFLNQIVEKPHSLYLQIGVQTGVISLLAFIVFFMIYFVRSIMLYWKHPLDTMLSKLGVALSASTLGYMISGITNDSTITYAIVFWGIMGVGIAVNHMVRAEINKQAEKTGV